MNNSLKITAIFVLILSFAQIIHAQDIEQEKYLGNLGTVVVTPTRIPNILDALSTNVSVVTDEEIRRRDLLSVADALQLEEGLNTSRVGTLGSSSSLSIRGTGPQQVLLMLDSVPINNTSLGLADLGTIPLYNIERLEIVRGPFSALYGPNALGGTVNIITNRAKYTTPVTDVYASFGDYATRVYNLSFGLLQGDSNGYFAASKNSSDGFRENSDYESDNFNVNLGHNFGRNGIISINGIYTKYELGVPGPNPTPIEEYDGMREVASDSPNAREEDEKEYIQISYELPLEENEIRTKLYGSNEERDYRNPDSFIDDDYKYITKGTEIQFRSKKGFLIGVDIHQDRFRKTDRTIDLAQIEKKITNKSVFLEEIVRFSNLTTILGLRLDHNSVYKEQINPRLSLIYNLNPIWKLSLSAGRAYRAPTFNDLFWPRNEETFFGINYITQGNEDLESETSVSCDFGVQAKLSKSFLGKMTIFHSKIKDLIKWSSTESGSTILYQPENVEKGINQGLELGIETRILPKITQTINYTYLYSAGKSEDEDDYVVLEFKPHHRANCEIDYLNDFGFSLNLSCEYVHNQWERRDKSGHRIPSRTILNGRVSQKILDAEVFLALDNITDKRYITRTDGFGKFYPLPGRTLRGGIAWRFWG